MLKLLLPLLLLAGFWFFVKARAQASGNALLKTSKPLQHDQLDALFQKLADAAGIDHVQVRLLPEASINGLATDTGEIYITQGLFDTYRRGEVTAQEIASVAAHEMGHVALGHMKRRMIEVAGRQAAGMVLGGFLARAIPIVGGYIAAWLLNLLTATLSRRDEFEADAYATALMVRSGLGAEAQASMLEKLPKLVPGSTAVPSWMASHPPAEERASAIRENAARWQMHMPNNQISS
ncbi:MAG: M48 family metalloprotease [Pseudomonadota bacterium]